jgi:hypothetical protein
VIIYDVGKFGSQVVGTTTGDFHVDGTTTTVGTDTHYVVGNDTTIVFGMFEIRIEGTEVGTFS